MGVAHQADVRMFCQFLISFGPLLFLWNFDSVFGKLTNWTGVECCVEVIDVSYKIKKLLLLVTFLSEQDGMVANVIIEWLNNCSRKSCKKKLKARLWLKVISGPNLIVKLFTPIAVFFVLETFKVSNFLFRNWYNFHNSHFVISVSFVNLVFFLPGWIWMPGCLGRHAQVLTRFLSTG